MSTPRWFLGGLLAASLAASSLRAEAPSGPQQLLQESQRPSIHQRELESWKLEEIRGWSPWVELEGEPAGPRKARTVEPSHEIHGYHPYWMGNAYATYDWSLLTTVAFFSLELNGAGEITDRHGWPWTDLIGTAHENGVRVLATATLFSTSEINTLLSSSDHRQAAIDNLVSAVLEGGADGINIDFEGVPGSRKQDLVTFMDELASALATSLDEPYLSMATPAVDWSNAFDYDELAARCDHLMVMAYDYHWSGSPTTGPVAPLGGWGTYNVAWTIEDYQTWGTPPGKMVLGVPYYGYRWAAASGEPGATTLSPGTARTYAQAQAEAESYGPLWDTASLTPWYRYQAPDWFQGWYDDGTSLLHKYDLTLGEDLAGVGIWALGYDGQRPELWAALAEAFGGGADSPEPPPDAGSDALAWVSVGPNPFRESLALRFVTLSGSHTSLGIFGPDGRRVRSLLRATLPGSGPHAVSWDGRDDRGERAAAGVYLARLKAGSGVRSFRIVRLP